MASTSARRLHCTLVLALLAACLWRLPAPAARADGDAGAGATPVAIAPDATNGTGDNSADAPARTNATPAELRGVENGIERLTRSVEAHDTETLQAMGLAAAGKANAVLTLRPRIVAAALSPAGALVRLDYLAWGAANDNAPAHAIAQGTIDVWLTRAAVVGGEVFTLDTRNWTPPTDAAVALAQAAGEEWAGLGATPDNDPSGAILHLVAQKLGGRWLALRRSRWDGFVLDNAHLAGKSRLMPGVRDRQSTIGLAQAVSPAQVTADVQAWLRLQMAQYDGKGAGVAHFILQRSAYGWVGLGSAWDASRNISQDNETQAARWREAMNGDGYLSPDSHRDFATVLVELGLYAEASDEAEKAEALAPGSEGPARLAQYNALRASDPQAMAQWEVQNETRIGIGHDHPIYVLNALAKEQSKDPTLLGALQIGLEYSKLAQDDRAAAWLKYADGLIAGGALKAADDNTRSWTQILHDQLAERNDYAGIKPRNIIRSGLFTLRCTLNDLSTLPVLAGLEAAQHVVYADFSVPMGNTEVVLWRNQPEFQQYTGRVAGEATSEFIAALTLTKLVQSDDGPVVLSDEVNLFSDDNANIIGTLRHEYGHVAVREVSKGRSVPTWFNEGIATSVEGGYDGYIQRVRDGAKAGKLLSMDEMLQWNVDGERAFLAYSQANSMLDYIGAKWGRGAVIEILRQIGRDTPPETAFENVLKITTQELWNRWARDGIM